MSTALVRVPIGVLADGTPYFAPLGDVRGIRAAGVVAAAAGRALSRAARRTGRPGR